MFIYHRAKREEGETKLFVYFLLLLLLLRSPATSLGFTILGEIFAYMIAIYSNHWGSHIPSSWMVHVGCVFVVGIHQSRTWMSGSFESVQWNAWHRFILSSERFWAGGGGGGGEGGEGDGVKTHVNPKGIPRTGKSILRWGSNPRRCIKQDSEPNTLPTTAIPAPVFFPCSLCSL